MDFRHGSVQEDMTSGTHDEGAFYHRPHKRDSSQQCGSAGVRTCSEEEQKLCFGDLESRFIGYRVLHG